MPEFLNVVCNLVKEDRLVFFTSKWFLVSFIQSVQSLFALAVDTLTWNCDVISIDSQI